MFNFVCYYLNINYIMTYFINRDFTSRDNIQYIYMYRYSCLIIGVKQYLLKHAVWVH